MSFGHRENRTTNSERVRRRPKLLARSYLKHLLSKRSGPRLSYSNQKSKTRVGNVSSVIANLRRRGMIRVEDVSSLESEDVLSSESEENVSSKGQEGSRLRPRRSEVVVGDQSDGEDEAEEENVVAEGEQGGRRGKEE